MPALTHTPATGSVYAELLTGYITGTVGGDALARFDDLFDETDATAQERIAFARFYLDALAAGDDADALPTAAEVPGILDAARA